MKRVLEYLYFRSYYIFDRLYGKTDSPQVSAWLFISLISFFIIMSGVNLIPDDFSDSVLKIGDGLVFPVLAIVLLVFFFFYFNYKSRYILIIRKFKDEDKPTIFALLIPVITFFSVVALYIISLVY